MRLNSGVIQLLLLATVHAAIHLPLSKSPRLVAKRGATGPVWVRGNGLSYVITFEIGGQTVQGELDTGSSDIWVVSGEACKVPNQNSSCNLPYYPNLSQGYLKNETVFNITYGDQSSTSGTYAQDILKLGDFVVQGANFAVAASASTFNVFGIGPKYTESCVKWKLEGDQVVLDENGCVPHDNLPTQMKRQGIIEAASYSIWLDKLIDGAGMVTFGGIVPGAVANSFYKLPIERIAFQVNDDGSYIKYQDHVVAAVLLNEIRITRNGTSTQIYQGALPALLDYGSTVCVLPTTFTSAIASKFGLDGTAFEVPCGKYDGYLTLNFRGVEIKVDLNDFIRPEYENHAKTSVCSLGMIPNSQAEMLILGDNVLSSMYVSFDYDNNEIGLGQATDEVLEEIIDIPPQGIDAPEAPQYNVNYTFSFVE